MSDTTLNASELNFKTRYVIEAFINNEWKQVSIGYFSVLANAESAIKLYYKKKYKKIQITEVWI